MKLGKWARVFLAALPLLAGCKGFWDVPSGSGGSGGGGTTSGVFYVLNQKTAEIAAYTIASGSTTLTKVTGSPTSLGTTVPYTMAISPNGGFLYVGTPVGIFAYSVGSSGALTILNGGQVITSDFAFTMQLDPSGSWLIDAVSGIGAVNAIPLDPTTGLVLAGASEQSVVVPSTAVRRVTITEAGAPNPYVFVAMGNGGTAVIPFTATSATNPFGAVSVIKPINPTTGGSVAVAVDLSRQLLYVGETVAVSGSNPGGLRVFAIGANSSMSELTGSPYPSGGIGPGAILPTSNYVYVANSTVSGSNGGNIQGFAITTTGTVYSLTAISTIAAGLTTVAMDEENTGTYLLAVNSGGTPDLNVYTFDATTAGKLDAYTTASTGSDPVQPVAVVAVP
jgi:6-phosphogluconolactonase (cycloisomerase 2 family)